MFPPSIFSVFIFCKNTQEDNKNIQIQVTLGSSGDWDKLESVCPYGFQFQKNFKTLWMKQNASLGRMPPSGQQFVASLSEVTQVNVYFCMWLLFEGVLYLPHLDGYLSNTNLA